jgi:hypothetical protein
MWDVHRREARHQPADRKRAPKVLSQAGLLRSKRIKQWTFYQRDETRIRELKEAILARV